MNSPKLIVDDIEVSVKSYDDADFISLTDMLKAKEGSFYVESWLRNRNTIEFLGMWEAINNPDFNFNEFDEIRKVAGLNSFRISVKEWRARTNAIGLKAVAGRYGGTYAHKDIAFEFGAWISPAFKLYLIKEYQRLKEIENNQYNIEWNVRRLISKTNYIMHTDAVKDALAKKELPWRKSFAYASEADLINLALFGMTAKEWRDTNRKRASCGENIRDTASINELIILSNLESYNSEMLKLGMDKEYRYDRMAEMVKTQRKSLDKADPLKSLKRLNSQTYLPVGKLERISADGSDSQRRRTKRFY